MPIKKYTLYNTLVNHLTKKGNKKQAVLLLNSALKKSSKKLNIGCHTLLAFVFKLLSVSIEVRDIKRRGKVLKIPFPISFNRQKYLSIKWFFKSIELDKRSCSFEEKLSLEFITLIKFKKSRALVLKKLNCKLAASNRANIHYRW